MVRKLVAVSVFLVLLASQPVRAWESVNGWTDPVSGQDYTAAADTNADGYSIHIFRDSDQRVRAVFSIPASSFDRMPREGRVLAIRPGNNDVMEIEAAIVGDSIVEKAQSNGVDVRSLLWHGEGPSPTRGTLRNILDSDTLSARFYTDTGTHLETQWSLDGATEVISDVIGISIEVDPTLQAWEEQQASLLISATNQCGTNTSCLGKVTPCFDLIIKGKDIEGFKSCVKLATK